MKNDSADVLLDKMQNAARRIAVALGGMFIASITSAILVNEWIAEQWRTSMMSFIGGMLAAALFGACVACCVLAPVLRSKINRISDEIDKRPTQKQLDEALAKKDARIKELECEADLDELEARFKKMSYRAKCAAYGASDNGVTDVIVNEETGMNKADPFWTEAENNGFLIMEPSGCDRARAVPTRELERLFEARPEIKKRVGADFLNEHFRQHPSKKPLPDGTEITIMYETDPEYVR